MLRFRDYSIARKLTSMNLLVSGAALLLAGGAFGAYELIAFRETLVANLSIQAQIVGSNSISALLFNDPASAEKTLSALQAAPHIEYASIYTPDGQPFAAYWRDPRRRAASLPSIPATQTKIHWFRDRQITVVRPIVFQGKPAGMVCIQSDLGEWTERLQRYAVIVAGVLLVSLMAAWLTSSVIRRSIAEPIVGLAETARVVSRERNYSVRAPLSSNRDELAVLIATFNEMLAQIQERDTTLRSEIAERKRLEEARERLAAVVESSDDAIISKTLEGTISTWNRGAEKVFGYAASEIVGKPMLTLIPPDRVDEEPAILAHIRRGESVEHFETVRVRKDGKKIDISATISPVRDGSGTIVGASKIARTSPSANR
jgi:PAS domain S-box-containing protein